MKLYRTDRGHFIVHLGKAYLVPEERWDALIAHPDLHGFLMRIVAHSDCASDFAAAQILAPIVSQEIWAAGVTYYRSRDARMAESQKAGGESFYDRVYRAERPELFFKGGATRVAAHGAAVRIRSDARWSVPEPELTLLINPRAQIIGYTIGNDMSSRDIEGENPLYLPQAKVYDGSSALGPCVLVSNDALPPDTVVAIEIERGGGVEFAGTTTLAQLKRTPESLVEYLFRDNAFPAGVYLMTGTGIVPPEDFTLVVGDRIRITLGAIGTLENVVAQGRPAGQRGSAVVGR